MQEIAQARIGKDWAAIKFFSHMFIDIDLEFRVVILR
jgi:hypothetical protein